MVDLNIELPESFFQEEERDGYLVSAKTKELWAVQLDLLNEFDRVCKKYGIKFMLDFGSLLGAVRHKGFIPWDDDLDVSMLREDYEKLIEIAPYEFKEPYFLQNHHSERNFSYTVAKLRRSDTTFLSSIDLTWERVNHGIFIDVFVYDSFPSDDIEYLKEIVQFSKTMHYRMQAMSCVPSINDGMKMILRYYYYNLRYRSIYEQYDMLEKFAKQFDNGPFKACIMSNMIRFYHDTWFDQKIEMPFENLMMPVSAYYDAILTLLYGDYMTPILGSSAHDLVYCDTCSSYLEVMKDKALMRKFKQEHYHF